LLFQLLNRFSDGPQLRFLCSSVRALFDKMLNRLLHQRQQGFGILDEFLFVHGLSLLRVRFGIASVENIPQRGIDAATALFEFVLPHRFQQLQHFGRASAMLLAEFFKELLIVGGQVHKVAVSDDEWAQFK
jgi:hypothetical protein